MAVFSVGVDLVEIARIRSTIDKFGERFLNKVFTAAEQAYCGSKQGGAECYAARFAAKEAVFKAAGTGLSTGMQWQDVEIVNDENGRPRVTLSGKTGELFKNKQVHLSLSHTHTMAIASVVVEELPGKPSGDQQ